MATPKRELGQVFSPWCKPANIFHLFWETFPDCSSKSDHLSSVLQLGQVHTSIIVINHSIIIIYIHLHLYGIEIRSMGTRALLSTMTTCMLPRGNFFTSPCCSFITCNRGITLVFNSEVY